MKLGKYELMLVLRPNLVEDEVQKHLKGINTLIEETNGKFLSEPNIEKRSLAYSIKKENAGIYITITYEASTDFNGKLNEMLKYDDNVLRYMPVLLND
ncbi:30S ribosomal protein S6 [bacterium]|nr:30S ribosomal protein S6 [bacterium]